MVSTVPLLLLLLTATGSCGTWTTGVVDTFDSSYGQFTGHVCVKVLTPRPACGWRVDMFFLQRLASGPHTQDAVLDFSLDSMDWFEFYNNKDGGNLSGDSAGCLNISIDGVVESTIQPEFEARMVCACYLSALDQGARTPNHHHSWTRPEWPTLLPCHWTPASLQTPTRLQTSLSCPHPSSSPHSPPSLSVSEVASHAELTSLSSPDDLACLKRVIREKCSDVKSRIPRVVHYVRFGEYNMSVVGFLSVVSAVRFVRPCLIVFHCDLVPEGPYWRALLSLLDNVVVAVVDRPRSILGNPVNKVEHSADVARLQLLFEYGGVYLDHDQLVLRSLDDLLNSSTVLGKETSRQCGNAFLLSEPRAPFLRRWLDNYTDFQDEQWAVHSTIRPYQLARDFPGLVRVVKTFYTPSWSRLRPYFHRDKVPSYDWSHHYGLHLYVRMMRREIFGGRRLDEQDSVVGDMVRHILYGDRYACVDV